MGTTTSAVLAKSALWDFGIQWGMWAISSALQTERFYDATGSGTFIYLALQSYQWGSSVKTKRQKVQTSLVVIWALRLGLFLMSRIFADGIDKRFNHVRDNPKVFLIYWTVQGVWIFLTLLPTLILNSEKNDVQVGTRDYIGWGLWGSGCSSKLLQIVKRVLSKLIPATRSTRKRSMRAPRAKCDHIKGKFINSGLWSVSRHPNYLGEILVWSGLYLSASSVFSGWQHVSVLSPLFVYFLLTRVSGIPLLERGGMKRWGSDPNYLEYIKNVPVLFPSLW
ncbi:hypothetical protein BSL78_00163 [Apostichopus japonicus]|uniref:Uncharacterized protein n=1 Tax=Stichopus japonicus TaxID=307972 RepID=A0A2G8LRN4_STIJA|nr:hypothetical protein BSL78_00163 [Apostichopus japonicus]